MEIDDPPTLHIGQTYFPYRASGHGILHYLGCKGRSHAEWRNPALDGVVDIRSSGLREGHLKYFVEFLGDVVTHDPNKKLVVDGPDQAWIEVSLPVGVFISGYQISHGAGESRRNFLRNWVLYGAFPGGDDVNVSWFPLALHEDDTSIDFKRWRAGFLTKVRTAEPFHRFRLAAHPHPKRSPTGDPKRRQLAAVGLEIFGTLQDLNPRKAIAPAVPGAHKPAPRV
ncbi:hypothetical protein DIPPA_23273 [Diplonema papillatum]|nr:hypothetical protein DIPPA_23273 [Diplonema papillatum]